MKVVNEKADDWDSHLASVIFGYRVNIQASTKMSPFELMYGVKARLPLDLKGDVPEVGEDEQTEAVNQRMVDLGQRLKEKREEARVNIQAAQKKQKERYDVKHSGAVYVVGQKVMKYNRRRETRMGDKLAQRFTGPFTIHEVLGSGVYRLMDGEKVLKQVVNASNLKPYIAPGSPEAKKATPRSPSTPSKSPRSATKSPRPSSPSAAGTTPRTQAHKPSAAGTAPRNQNRAPPADRARSWIPELNLDQADQELIASADGWLNDKVVDAVNEIVRDKIGAEQQQSTLLAQIPRGFSNVTTESIYILHANDHWITTACIGDDVLFADSAGGGVSKYVAGQMRQLYARRINSATDKLEIKITPCPRQTNASDCGVYAAAVAFEWAMGNQILPPTWDVPRMRPHLIECLEASSVARFPQGPVKRGRRPKGASVVV
jgi:hypothetical protein